MLRITTSECDPGDELLSVEGNIAVSGCEELERACRETASRGLRVLLDLSDVRMIDSHGVELLRRLIANGARITNDTPLIRELLRDSDIV